MAKGNMGKPNGTGGAAVSTLASVLASVVLVRSASKAASVPDRDHITDLASQVASDPPNSGVKRYLYRLDRYQRHHSWIGFPIGVVKKFGDDKAGHLAALVAYFGFFSIFPLMLAFTSIIGLVLDEDQQQRFAETAANQIPVVGDTIISTVRENGEVGGSTLAVVIGILVALWSGLKMIDAMQNALNDVWDLPPIDRPNMVIRRGRSFLMLLVLGGGIVGSVVVSSLATFLDGVPVIGRIGIWAGSAAISVIIYLLAFQLLTDTRLPWGDLVPGAIVGGLCWWGLQTFGTPIVTRAASGSDTFGPYASIIALMTFFFLASQLSIFAAEINVVRARRLWPRSLIKGDLTAADFRTYELLAGSTRRDEVYEVRIVPAGQAGADTPASAVAGK